MKNLKKTNHFVGVAFVENIGWIRLVWIARRSEYDVTVTRLATPAGRMDPNEAPAVVAALPSVPGTEVELSYPKTFGAYVRGAHEVYAREAISIALVEWKKQSQGHALSLDAYMDNGGR